jgi:peptide/nickel transport system substrate-binding protein
MSRQISRRKFIEVAGFGALGMALATVMAACSDDDATGAGGDRGAGPDEVVVGMTPSNEPAAGFDPFFGWGASEHAHEPLIMSTLITTTVDMGFENDLATAYQVSEDRLTWTFTIRDDVTFTDGVPLTASDVAFTVNGVKASPAAQVDLGAIRRALALDATTVVIEMQWPSNALLYALAVIGIVPEHAYSQGYGQNPIGSGRYMLEQWDIGQQVILRANPGYYGPKPLMQRVVVVFLEEDAALAAARSGQVDIVNTSAVYSRQAIQGYELFAAASVDSRGVSLPVDPPGGIRVVGQQAYPSGNAVTSDIAVRRALNLAIDRDLMVANVLNGYGTPAYTVSDGMPWASPDMQVAASATEARSLLAEAGWLLGDDGILTRDGLRASFDLAYPAYDSLRQALANELKNQARQVGIEVCPVGLSWSDIYPRAYSTPVLWGWGSNSPYELYALLHSESPSNFPGYANPVVDAYLEAALAAPTVEDGFGYWQQAQWDGSQGVAPQGAATWLWLANIDHLYFKREQLMVARQKLHPHGHGWSLANNIDRWSWQP